MNVTVVFNGMEFPICKVVADRYGLSEGSVVEDKKKFDKIIADHNSHTILLLQASKRFAN